MATRTTREITLPPEIVALVLSFKPEADHWESAHRYPPIYFICRSQGRLETTLFHSCCGKVGYKITDVCTQIANGMYHPGRLEVTILPRSTYPYGTTKSLQWSCCGTKIFTQSAIGRTPHYQAPGCTPLDLTLRDLMGAVDPDFAKLPFGGKTIVLGGGNVPLSSNSSHSDVCCIHNPCDRFACENRLSSDAAHREDGVAFSDTGRGVDALAALGQYVRQEYVCAV